MYTRYLKRVYRIAAKKGALSVDRATFFAAPWCVEFTLQDGRKQYAKTFGKRGNITLSKKVDNFSEAVDKGF
ncbi:MAG: hypothetical protein LWW94_09920 [Candidatus Desulfofervidaceae bacterium]|nr:hypothetical protein [Candidatus Desulfofervidaceae bacterium]